MSVVAALRARWPWVRAALITAAIASGLLYGCPVPDRKVTPDWARGIVDRGDAVRKWLLEPVAWLGPELDILQRWSLFRGASRKRFRLYFEGRASDGAWRLLHRAGDPAHDEYGALLAFRRTRGVYNPNGQNARAQFRPFASWLIWRMLDEHPEFTAGRIRLERVVIDEDGYRPTGEFTLEHQELRRRK